jgi:hypothetical protein
MIGKRFENISGKRIQVPNRISEEFYWGPGERIEILRESGCLSNSGEIPGYIVHNIDYVGAERCFETSWISKEVLNESFKEISK